VDIDRLRIDAVSGNADTYSAASNPDLYADTTPHANVNTDAITNTRFRLVSMEACLVQVHSGESA
jgi:hypothetical protein